MELSCNENDPPLGGIFFTEYLNDELKQNIKVKWCEETLIECNGKRIRAQTTNDVCRILAKIVDEKKFYGDCIVKKTEVDSWLTLSTCLLASKDKFDSSLDHLNKCLIPVTFLSGKRVTIADFAVFASLHVNKQWQSLMLKSEAPVNVLRWHNYMKSLPCIQKVLLSIPSNVKIEATNSRSSVEKTMIGNRAQEGKFVDLPGAEMGKVIVRFPPEASGYLHIGHAKAALLNQYYQQAFEGKLIMRFDDTNPAKENVHFEKVILEDVELLQIKPDIFTHTSQYFDLMLEYCEKMLKEGKAYVDDTAPELMKEQREQKIESLNRNNSFEKNNELWNEMLKGAKKGLTCCVRAKIDMQSANGCMRDPTIYRCKNELHPRTGNKYKVYPTYDFACPIVDSIEGVTHALRTLEYHDRDVQYYWFINELGLRKPYIWEYSRLSMTNTVLSKRKLTWFVEEGLVDGWDDPRMPTVRGVLRRGMTVEGLKQFIIAQGSSRSVVFMEWDKIWAINKKIIDPIAPRYTTIDYDLPVPIFVSNAKEEKTSAPKHPKNSDIGNKDMWISKKILIDRADAELLKSGENATFINWGNLLIKKINKENGNIISIDAETNLDNKDYKKTLKLTWLAVTDKAPFTPTWCVYFEHIISKALLGKDEDFKQYVDHDTRKEVQMLGDPELRNVKKGDIIQIQRKGFFIVDVPYRPPSQFSGVEQPVILFYIPDGHTKETPASNVAASKVKTKCDQPDGINVSREKILQQGKKQGKTSSSNTSNSENDLLNEIAKQGERVRQLKSDKADKSIVTEEVKKLLALKDDFKTAFGKDWKPGMQPTILTSAPVSVAKEENSDSLNKATSNTSNSENDLLTEIAKQGERVRQLKSDKADKSIVAEEVKKLLALKADFKTAFGKDWKPGMQPTIPTSAPVSVAKEENRDSLNKATSNTSNSENDLLMEIAKQGERVRQLKSDKADKSIVAEEVKKLLALKADFKTAFGKTWAPGMQPTISTSAITPTSAPVSVNKEENCDSVKVALTEKITAQGDIVRTLKLNNSSKEEVNAAVQVLLNLKTEYKKVTGTDFPVLGKSPSKPKENKAKEVKEKVTKQKSEVKDKKPVNVNDALKKQTRLGLETRKEENLADWYSQVITKGEMIEYYDVSGCYIFRPWSFAVWEAIKDWFDVEIKKLGIQNCYFPMFVPKAVLEKEKTHIADFAPEVAWVTKSGDSEMAEPIAIRPTSETVMYPAYARWIQSYRDLPIKLNQWNNVVRWEFKHPQPFLRTREFLWQEGHTAFADAETAKEEVGVILDLYAQVYTNLLAIPVVKGRKTEKEKFAGGDYTFTVEAFVSASGRAIQGATSHHLGQNFSKMFEIVFDDPETQEKRYVYQNSWGITTRTIGVMIMVHADNQGLVLPPKVACIQIIIVPCGITVNLSETDRKDLMASCLELETELKEAGVRVKGDYRDNYSPGWKFNHWELKGVPIRVELGPKDIKNKQLIAVRRDNGEKILIKRGDASGELSCLLQNIQQNLYNNACKDLKDHTITLTNWSQFSPNLDKKNIILAPFCGDISCEDKIKADSTRDDSEIVEPGAPSMGAKSLCIPLEQPAPIKETDKCIHPECLRKPQFYTLFGRSY